MRNATKELLKILDIKQLYPPQKEALRLGVEKGENLVVATPTASGKTLIGLFGIVNSLRDNPGKIAAYTAPLRSIAYEKMTQFSKLYKIGIKTRIEVGNLSKGPKDANLLVTTYEKLDSLLRNKPETINDLAVVVIDELHYIGDEKRGPILESLITRILYTRSEEIQLIALSATMPNLEDLARWMNARPLSVNWRPVPLREGVYKDGWIRFSDHSDMEVKLLSPLPYINPLYYYAKDGAQALVFSQSRRRVASLADKTAKSLGSVLVFDKEKAKEIANNILRSEGPLQLREKLSELIRKGVAFHHAGLSNNQRKIIEEGFRNGAISVIHATPTLAAGVNLPARVVIIEEYYRYEAGQRKPIAVYEYKQLAGRAGRPGYDKVGDAIIIASRSDTIDDLFEYYINGEIEEVTSKLSSLKSLRHIVLGILDAGIVTNKKEVIKFISKTFYSYIKRLDSVRPTVERSLSNLVDWGLIETDPQSNVLLVTPLGHAISQKYLDPANIPVMRMILNRVSNITPYHALYMIAASPDMIKLPVSRREEEYLMDRTIDEIPELVDLIDWFGPKELENLKIMFILADWINEVKDDEISSRFNIGPGDLSAIIETGEWISSSLADIVQLLGASLETAQIFKIISNRIKHGVKEELLPLVAVPGIGRVRARRLFESGYRTLHDLALASPDELMKIPGIGASTVRAIMEFFGRKGEEERIAKLEDVEKRGLEAFMD